MSATCGLFCGLFITKMIENSVIEEYYKIDQVIWLGANGLGMIVFAILFYCLRKNVSKWMTGSFAAATLATTICAMIDSWFSDQMPAWVTLIVVGALAVCGFLLAVKMPDWIVMIGSCWIGCYCGAAGVGILLEQYPRRVYGVGWFVFWIYFLSQIIAFILCVLFQSAE